MVARDDMGRDARLSLGARASGLFLAWRRILSSVVASIVLAGRRAFPAIAGCARLARLLAEFAARPAPAAADPRALRSLARAGLLSAAAGGVLSLALARPLRVPMPEAAVAAVWTLGWMGLRLGIMRVAAARTSPSIVLRAWAAGLVPGIAGVTDPLRALVLVLSARQTLGALEGSGVERRAARIAVGWAFGVEVGASVLRWLGSGLLLYSLAVR